VDGQTHSKELLNCFQESPFSGEIEPEEVKDVKIVSFGDLLCFAGQDWAGTVFTGGLRIEDRSLEDEAIVRMGAGAGRGVRAQILAKVAARQTVEFEVMDEEIGRAREEVAWRTAVFFENVAARGIEALADH
jgi:hypothetical protein